VAQKDTKTFGEAVVLSSS